MNTRFFKIMTIFLLLLTACGTDMVEPRNPMTDQPSNRHNDPRSALAGSYIVAFRTNSGELHLNYANYFAEHRAHYSVLAERYSPESAVKDIRFLTAIDLRGLGEFSSPKPFFSPLSQLRVEDDLMPRHASLARVDFSNEKEAKDLLKKWQDNGDIWFAEPNYISQTRQTDSSPPEEQTSPFADLATQYSALNRWWFEATDVTAGYEFLAQQGVNPDDRPIIAVLDSGVDYEHPALANNIWINTDLNAADCKNDIHGCNTTEATRGFLGNGEVYPFGTSGPGQNCIGKDPNCSHGTHVAGIIAGDPNWKDDRGRSAAGVCPYCRIMILKIVSNVGKQSGILDSSIIAAFKYVTLFRREGSPAVRVVNASFGKFVRSRSVGLLVRLMKEKNDTLLIGAAGNEDTLTMEYPAAFTNAIAVAAVDSKLRKVSFSNYGRWIEIAAPGQNILATVPGGMLDTKSGTSMAAPMVSATAGLMLIREPNISFGEMRRWLIESADPTLYSKDHEGGYNYTYYYPKIPQSEVRQPLLGYGLLNINGALQKKSTDGLPVFTALDRVEPGCGTVGGASKGSSVWALFLGGVLPMFLAVAYRRKKPIRIKS